MLLVMRVLSILPLNCKVSAWFQRPAWRALWLLCSLIARILDFFFAM